MKKEGKMRLRKCLLPVTLIFMAIGFFGCVINPENYYPLNEGDERTYEFTLDIVGGPNDGVHISTTIEDFVFGEELVNGMPTIKKGTMPPNADYFFFLSNPQGIKICKNYRSMTNRYVLYEPCLLVFPSMFIVGATCKRSTSFSVYSADDDTLVDTYTGNTTVTFESIEDVTVPAGTFKNCVKISVINSHDRASGGTFEDSNTTWYAKDVGMIKQIVVQKSTYVDEENIEATSTHELISAIVDGKTY